MHILKCRLNFEMVKEWATARNISTYDVGYLAHAFFRYSMGDDGPQPFRIEIEEGSLFVEGVVAKSEEALKRSISREREAFEEIRTSPVRSFDAGEDVSLNVRLCPVSRNSESGKPVETDVFLTMLRRAEAASEVAPKRFRVYQDWTASRFGKALQVSRVQIKTFTEVRPCRRGNPGHVGSPGAIGWRPVVDAFVAGTVTDQEAFSEVLRKGIGRHKAFGFGYVQPI